MKMEVLVIGMTCLCVGAGIIPGVNGIPKDDGKDNSVVFVEKDTHLFHAIPSWQWATSAGGTNTDMGCHVAADPTGNTYITGLFTGTATFGDTTLISQGSYDVFVAKLSANGSWLWAVRAGGTEVDWGYGISVDANLNSYITGEIYGTATFGNTTLVSQGASEVFVAKLSASGGWLWAVSAGGADHECGENIKADANGNTCITGRFEGTATFGNTTLTSQGLQDVFVAKLSASGGWLWAVSAGGANNDLGYGLAVDASGEVSVSGRFEGVATFGNTTLTSQWLQEVFVAKLSASGNWLWAVSTGGANNNCGYGLAMDPNGSIFATGEFSGIATFGNTTLTSQGEIDVFVAKISSDGAWQWATSAGGTLVDRGYDLAVDSTRNTYVTGEFDGDATFGNTTLTSQGASDVFVSKLSANGSWLWAVSAGGDDGDYGYGIAIDANRNAYITGGFLGSSAFGNTTLTSQGGIDVFVATLTGSGNQKPVADFSWTPSDPIINQPITFDASASHSPEGSITLYEWDWNNDSVFEENHTTPTATHAWPNPGSYPVTLRVKDEYSAAGLITYTIEVSGTVLFTVDIAGGLGVKATIRNGGSINATKIKWTISLTNGFILLGRTKGATIMSLEAGASTLIKDNPIFGFGKTTIMVEISCAEGASAIQTRTATAMLFFITGVQ